MAKFCFLPLLVKFRDQIIACHLGTHTHHILIIVKPFQAHANDLGARQFGPATLLLNEKISL